MVSIHALDSLRIATQYSLEIKTLQGSVEFYRWMFGGIFSLLIVIIIFIFTAGSSRLRDLSIAMKSLNTGFGLLTTTIAVNHTEVEGHKAACSLQHQETKDELERVKKTLEEHSGLLAEFKNAINTIIADHERIHGRVISHIQHVG